EVIDTRATPGSLTSNRSRSLRIRWICAARRWWRENSRGMRRSGPGTEETIGSGRSVDLARHLDALVALDLVAYLDVIIVPDANAAFRTGPDLVHVVLEAPERLQLAFEDDDVVAQHANRVVAPDVALGDDAARDVAELRRHEDLLHLGQADDVLPDLRCEQAAHRRLHVVDRLVDDAVVANVHARFLDRVPRRVVRAHVEPDDRGLGRRRQRGVRLGDAADAGGDHLDLHLVGRKLRERVAQRFRTAVHVGLDQQRDGLLLSLRHLAEHVLELRRLLLRELRLACLGLAVLRDLARLALVLHHEEVVARVRRLRQPEHDDRGRRPGAIHHL